jgi:hypothetical protein
VRAGTRDWSPGPSATRTHHLGGTIVRPPRRASRQRWSRRRLSRETPGREPFSERLQPSIELVASGVQDRALDRRTRWGLDRGRRKYPYRGDPPFYDGPAPCSRHLLRDAIALSDHKPFYQHLTRTSAVEGLRSQLQTVPHTFDVGQITSQRATTVVLLSKHRTGRRVSDCRSDAREQFERGEVTRSEGCESLLHDCYVVCTHLVELGDRRLAQPPDETLVLPSARLFRGPQPVGATYCRSCSARARRSAASARRSASCARWRALAARRVSARARDVASARRSAAVRATVLTGASSTSC